MQEKLLLAKSKEQIQTTKSDIIKYIKYALEKEPKQMISYLINQVVLYDDKVEIYYNYTDYKRPDEDGHQAFLFYTENFEKTYSYLQKEEQDINKIKVKIRLELYI